MILASHNSLTFNNPQWYLRPFAWIGRCQNLNIDEQYAYGVRYFDIRVKFDGILAISGHGFLTYHVCIDDILRKIEMFNETCVVRLTLEDSKASYSDKTKFKIACEYWENTFTGTIFTGGCQKGTWKLLYQFKLHRQKDIKVIETFWLFDDIGIYPYIRHYAKIFNSHNKEVHKESDYYLMMDFIQY